MLNVYESFHEAVIYGQQKKSYIMRVNWLEIKISMKAHKTENRFQTGFQQPKSSVQNGISIPRLNPFKPP